LPEDRSSAIRPPADFQANRLTPAQISARMFRALNHPNFRRFLSAQACAMTGHWVQHVALGWLVYRLTDSAFYLGLAGTFSLLPSLILTPFVGVLADNADRRRILLATQSAAFVHSLLLAAVAFTGVASLPLLLGFALFQGVIQGFDWTNRQSLLAQLVDDRADLPNAIALNSTSFNLARIVGPTLASALLVVSGEAACFLFAALAEACAVQFTRRLRLPPRPAAGPRPLILTELREGLRYAWHEPAIRRTLFLVALASASILPYAALLPVFATRVFGGGPELLGLLNAAPAVGAVLGGLLLASRREQAGLERRIFLAGLIAAIATAGLALAPNLALALPALVVLGAGQISWMASMNTLLQTVVRDSLRGRVMSFFNMAFMASLPLGQLVFGAASDRFGVARIVLAGAAVGLFGNLWLHRRRIAPPALVHESPGRQRLGPPPDETPVARMRPAK
jgi:MFS family permease